jgi:hypothetical protein
MDPAVQEKSTLKGVLKFSYNILNICFSEN